jgi:hypothetical protein
MVVGDEAVFVKNYYSCNTCSISSSSGVTAVEGPGTGAAVVVVLIVTVLAMLTVVVVGLVR